MKQKKLNLKEIEKEAFAFIADYDEYAEIIPEGRAKKASKLIAEFIHKMWEKDIKYEPK